VQLNELRLENLRNIARLELELAPGVNVFTGANGAGKTSILEAAYLLSHAYSFRTRRGELLVRRDAGPLSVFGLVRRDSGATTRLGLVQAGGRWSGRVDGRTPTSLAAVLEHCAVVCFDPGAHALISGVSEERRRFLDWGVFHVEPHYAETARRYQRALRQRNSALREGRPDAEVDAWDEELAAAAEPVRAARARYLERLEPVLKRLLGEYLPELGEAGMHSSQGWTADRELAAVLRDSRGIDRTRAHTTRGPHRADWSVGFERAARREHLSRGQEKLCAIACALAQAAVYVEDHAEWPIVLLDDLPSELDRAHQDRVLRSLGSTCQILLTSTEIPQALQRTSTGFRRFHVEQGSVEALL
jgi:DNA replication and repair protein RecF